MFALLLALGPSSCMPAELGKIDPPAAMVAQGPARTAPLPAAPAPAPPPTAPSLPSPLTRDEWTQYRIAFGVLGNLGELKIVLTPGPRPGDAIRLLGQVKASLFGIGETDKRVLSEFDPRSLAVRRWSAYRSTGGKTVTDFARQAHPGTVALLRRRPGRPDQPDTLRRKVEVLDPLSFILRLRVATPHEPQSYEVLDGHGLWQITTSPATRGTGDMGRALRVDGKAEPIFWDGSRDEERPRRTFSVWLSDDEFRTPLRLVLPLSVGEVRADLVTVTRSTPRGGQAATGGASPAHRPALSVRLHRALARWLP
jgi:hypothetical protein